MKLIYNPFYKARPYRKMSGTCFFNEKTVGTSALLAELELRAGLSCRVESSAIRAISYRKALKQHLASLSAGKKSFFADSFSVDDLGVSAELLKWRDALVLSGWNSEVKGISDKIDELAAVERIFRTGGDFKPGEADRWVQICEFTSRNVVLDSSDTIEVLSDKKALLPVIEKTFENMESKGLAVEFRKKYEANSNGQMTNLKKFQAFLAGNSTGYTWSEGDGSLSLVHFRDTSSEYEWAASNAGKDGYDVTVCPDTKLLNDSLLVFGEPVVDSMMDDSNPQILQLLSLGVSLFYRPLDINNLLSYLLIPVNPLPRKLRGRLIRALVKDNGLGETWNAVFEGDDRYVFVNEDEKESEKIPLCEDMALRKRKMKFISMVMDGDFLQKVEQGFMIRRDALKEYVSSLLLWSYGRCSALESEVSLESAQIREQLISLNTICEAFQFLLGEEEKLISQIRLAQWLSHICTPGSFMHKKALSGSVDIAEDIHDITDSPDSMLWLGCNGDSSLGDLYAFLSPDEKKNLKGKGMKLLPFEDLISAEREDIRRAVCSVGKRLTIVSADRSDGESQMEHYILSVVKKAFGMDSKGLYALTRQSPLPNAKFHEEKVKTDDLGKREMQEGFSEGILKLNSERYLSHSQLEQLIQRPFQYVINYLANLQDTGSLGLSELYTVQGTLAHKYIESLVESGKGTAPFIETAEEDFDKAVEALAQEYAAIMLLDENRINFTSYKKRLYRSVRNLGHIISGNGLDIAASEYKCENVIDGLGKFIGYIDLLLKTADGKYIIFDLKWSDGNSYNRKLADNKAAQLRIYEELLKNEGKELTLSAYYILPQGHLLIRKSDANKLAKLENVFAVDCCDTSDLMEKLKASFDFRLDQLSKGEVEDAEGMKIESLDYAEKTDMLGLFPIDTDASKAKYAEYGNKNRILRGDLK